MKTNADIWNWVLATAALTIIFISIVPPFFSEPPQASETYTFIFLIIQPSLVCLVVLGLYSLIIRKSVPILGAVIGTALYIPVMIVSAIIQFVLVIAIMPLYAIAPWLWMLNIPQLIFALVAIGLLIAAFVKRPKEKKGKSQPPTSPY
jgi:hypothetical protein